MTYITEHKDNQGLNMRLTKQTNYAIRMLIYCAANENKLSQVSEIAKAYAVSELFLFKILPLLVENGFIKTVRGRKGGICLAQKPEEIYLDKIVKITEENFALAECFDKNDIECPLINGCSLHNTFKKALDAFLDVLAKTSIADLQRPNFRTKLGIND